MNDRRHHRNGCRFVENLGDTTIIIGFFTRGLLGRGQIIHRYPVGHQIVIGNHRAGINAQFASYKLTILASIGEDDDTEWKFRLLQFEFLLLGPIISKPAEQTRVQSAHPAGIGFFRLVQSRTGPLREF